MSDNVFDGLYAPSLAGLTERGHRWPWVVAAVGTAIVLVGGAAYSEPAEHAPGAPPQPASLAAPASR